MSENSLRLYAEMRDLTGISVRIISWENVTGFVSNDTQAFLSTEKYKSREGARGVTLTHKGIRIVQFRCDENTSTWSVVSDVTTWDKDYEPEYVANKGKSVSVHEYVANIRFARDCHRPGTHVRPLDSYARVLEASSTKEMEAYW